MKCSNCGGDSKKAISCCECGSALFGIPWEAILVAVMLLLFSIVIRIT